MAEAGFGKVDITPRVGVEMSGFGPYLHRVGRAIHDPIYARAMAVRAGGEPLVIVSCDLIDLERATVQAVRKLVTEATGVAGSRIMVHCTHTHSAPAVCAGLMGWGELDAPYMYRLPNLIARACIEAVQDLGPASFKHAETPCEGIAYNREYDTTATHIEDLLDDNWRPAKPELTDTNCHVMTIEKQGGLAGFVSYFGCHPVSCCALTTQVHGDFCGVATNALEREHPGATGLFIQGAQGDINTCVVHRPEDESMRGLAALSKRYADSVRRGMADASPIDVTSISAVSRQARFTRLPLKVRDLEARQAEFKKIVDAASSDQDSKARLCLIYVLRYQQMIERMQQGDDMHPLAELQGMRLGPVSLLSAPLEIFQAIKRDVVADANSEIPLVVGITNDAQGYAPDNERAKSADAYTVHTVATIFGQLPYSNIHDELAGALVDLDRALQ